MGPSAPRRIVGRMPGAVSRPTALTRARTLGPLVGLALAVAGGLWALGQHGALLVHRCVPEGLGVGVRLALLRPDADCPSGLAVGAETPQVVAVVVMVTLPVLLAHLLGAGLGLGLLGHVRAVVRGAATVLLGRRPEARALATVPVHPLVPAVPVRVAVARLLAGDLRRRGPPVLLTA